MMHECKAIVLHCDGGVAAPSIDQCPASGPASFHPSRSALNVYPCPFYVLPL